MTKPRMRVKDLMRGRAELMLSRGEAQQSVYHNPLVERAADSLYADAARGSIPLKTIHGLLDPADLPASPKGGLGRLTERARVHGSGIDRQTGAVVHESGAPDQERLLAFMAAQPEGMMYVPAFLWVGPHMWHWCLIAPKEDHAALFISRDNAATRLDLLKLVRDQPWPSATNVPVPLMDDDLHYALEHPLVIEDGVITPAHNVIDEIKARTGRRWRMPEWQGVAECVRTTEEILEVWTATREKAIRLGLNPDTYLACAWRGRHLWSIDGEGDEDFAHPASIFAELLPDVSAMPHAPHVPPGWRSDGPLLRHMQQGWDVDLARRWQHLPLIVFPRELARGGWKEGLEALGRDRVPMLPADDLVVDHWEWLTGQDTDTEIPRVHCWNRITLAETYLQRQGRYSPWVPEALTRGDIGRQVSVDIDEVWVFVESWADVGDAIRGPYVHCLMRPEAGDDVNPYLAGGAVSIGVVGPWFEHRYGFSPETLEKVPKGHGSEALETLRSNIAGARGSAIDAMGLLQYAIYGPDHLVRVSEPVRSAKQARKAEATHPKPYLREGLPFYTLWTPGVRLRRRSGDGGGTHATPVPHERRGTMVDLYHPRYYRLQWADDLLGEPMEAPPVLTAVEYDTGIFRSGIDQAEHPRAFRTVMGPHREQLWQELRFRQVPRSGSRVNYEDELEDERGRIYRVLDPADPKIS